MCYHIFLLILKGSANINTWHHERDWDWDYQQKETIEKNNKQYTIKQQSIVYLNDPFLTGTSIIRIRGCSFILGKMGPRFVYQFFFCCLPQNSFCLKWLLPAKMGPQDRTWRNQVPTVREVTYNYSKPKKPHQLQVYLEICISLANKYKTPKHPSKKDNPRTSYKNTRWTKRRCEEVQLEFDILATHRNAKGWRDLCRVGKRQPRKSDKTYAIIPHTIHIWYVYLHLAIWLIFMVNVGKYTMVLLICPIYTECMEDIPTWIAKKDAVDM